MSADKDRGIRRQKQKRAKRQKKLARTPRPPVGTAPVQAAEPLPASASSA